MEEEDGRRIKGEEDTQGQCLLPDDTSGLLVELVMLRQPRLGSPLSLRFERGIGSWRWMGTDAMDRILMIRWPDSPNTLSSGESFPRRLSRTPSSSE
jgi:hypothetical protein